MALATQCPHCQTTFKVAHDQLKLRAGLVRCGACKQIFNGIEHLVPPEQLLSPEPHLTPAPEVPAERVSPALPKRQPPQHVELPLPLTGNTRNAAGTDDRPAELPETPPETVQFTSSDDPETYTQILTTKPEIPEAPSNPAASVDARPSASVEAEEADEDPLTRMTLVDFTAFDLDDEEPVEPVPVTTPVAENGPPTQPVEPIWPDTRDQFIVPDTVVRQNDAAVASTNARLPTAPAAVFPVAVSTPDPVTEKTFSDTLDNTSGHDEDRFESGTDHDAAVADGQDAADVEEPGFVTRSRRRQRISRITRGFMAIASVMLVLGLMVQATYAFRNQLAAWFPQTKPGLAQFCQIIGCQVKLPSQIDMVSIESHELQALATDKNIFVLTLLLRNRSTVVQAWPTIELTLNDGNEKPLARKMLAPHQYLPSEKDVTRGFLPQSEQAVKVSFALNQLTASGYRVYLFYP